MYETLLVDREDRLTWLTLNRPDSLNAMNDQLVQEFGRSQKLGPSIKPAAKCWEPKACGDRCGTKDLEKNMGQNMGPMWDKRFGKINFYLKSDAI